MNKQIKLKEWLLNFIEKHKPTKNDTFKFEKEWVTEDTYARWEIIEIEGYKFSVKTNGNWYVKYPNCSDGWDYDTCTIEIEVLETPLEEQVQKYEGILEKRLYSKINEINKKIEELNKDAREWFLLEQKELDKQNYSVAETYQKIYSKKYAEIRDLQQIRDYLNNILIGDEEFIAW